jgi:hypothetical protein
VIEHPGPGRQSAAGTAAVVVAAVLAACGSPAPPAPAVGSPSPAPIQQVTGVPPADPGLATRLVTVATTGTAEVGTFVATRGDLWLGGRCTGGELELRVDPVAVFPIPCDSLGGLPFLNRVVMRRPTMVTVSAVAPAEVTWNLRVEQGAD